MALVHCSKIWPVAAISKLSSDRSTCRRFGRGALAMLQGQHYAQLCPMAHGHLHVPLQTPSSEFFTECLKCSGGFSPGSHRPGSRPLLHSRGRRKGRRGGTHTLQREQGFCQAREERGQDLDQAPQAGERCKNVKVGHVGFQEYFECWSFEWDWEANPSN